MRYNDAGGSRPPEEIIASVDKGLTASAFRMVRSTLEEETFLSICVKAT